MAQTGEIAMDTAKGIVSGNEMLTPVFIVGTPEGAPRIIPFDTSSEEAKQRSRLLLKLVVANLKADFVVMVVETWFKHTAPGHSLPPGVRVSDFEDKREGILVAAVNKEGERYHMLSEIVRDENGVTFKDDKEEGENVQRNKFLDGLWGVT